MQQRKVVAAIALSLCLTTLWVSVVSGGALAPNNLLVEYLRSPVTIGIDTENPRFAFAPQVERPNEGDRGLMQLAYQIVVSRDSTGNDVVWDSGRVDSSQTSQIVYGSSGRTIALESSSTYYWRARWWPNAQLPGSVYSATAQFNTGYLKGQSEWNATWIGGSLNQYRKGN